MAYPRLGDDDAFTFSKGSEVVLLHYHPVISFAGSSPPGRKGPGQQSQTRQRVRLPRNKDRAPSALGGRPLLTPGRLLHRQPARSRPILPVLDIFPVSPCLLMPQPQSPSLRLSEACSATCDSSSSGFARPSLTSSNRNKLLPVPGTPFGCGTRRGLSVPQEAAGAAWLHLLKAWDVSRAGTGLPSSPCTHLPNPKPKLWTISG